MDYIDKSIEKNVKSGRYFLDVMNWYERKYIYPSTEKSILAIIALVLVVTMIVTLNYTINIFPLKKFVSIPLSVESLGNEVPIIKNIGSSDDDVNFSFASYLLSNYVVNRENYDYNNLELQTAFLKNNSTKTVFDDFAKQIDMSNPESLIYKYQNNMTRETKIISVSKIKNSDKINIIFINLLLNNSHNIVEKVKKQAIISYVMNDVEKNADSLNFMVEDYKVNDVK